MSATINLHCQAPSGEPLEADCRALGKTWPDTELVKLRSGADEVTVFTDEAGLRNLSRAIDARLTEIDADRHQNMTTEQLLERAG